MNSSQTTNSVVQRILDDAGINAATLARKSGKSPSQISTWLHGRENPRPQTIATLCRAAGLNPLDYGAGEDDDPSAMTVNAVREALVEPPEWFKQFIEQQTEFQADIRRQLNTIERKLK